MLKIKEFARLCKCSVYTLRYYDKIDLLVPKITDNISGYRFYEENQLDEYIEIKEFQSIGFNILEIKSIKYKCNKDIADLILLKINYMEEVLDKAYLIRKKYLEGKQDEKI